MKKIILASIIIVILIGGLVVMADSEENIKSVERKIYYGESPILEDKEILDVNGTTYVPLRALCESTRKGVEWNANKGEAIIRDEQWDYPKKPLPYIPQKTAIPDAETAYKIADIMFGNFTIDTKSGEKYHLIAYGSPKDVEYDEKYEAWVVYGDIICEKKEDRANYLASEIPSVIVLRKDNGEVIAFWA